MFIHFFFIDFVGFFCISRPSAWATSKALDWSVSTLSPSGAQATKNPNSPADSGMRVSLPNSSAMTMDGGSAFQSYHVTFEEGLEGERRRIRAEKGERQRRKERERVENIEKGDMPRSKAK